MKLIDKDAVVAVIKKIYNEDYKFLPSDLVESVQDFKDDLLIALDTLEMREVDLDNGSFNEEVEKYLDDFIKTPTRDYFRDTIRHFFELGLQSKKGEQNESK